jgi:hypothetical protein
MITFSVAYIALANQRFPQLNEGIIINGEE